MNSQAMCHSCWYHIQRGQSLFANEVYYTRKRGAETKMNRHGRMQSFRLQRTLKSQIVFNNSSSASNAALACGSCRASSSSKKTPQVSSGRLPQCRRCFARPNLGNSDLQHKPRPLAIQIPDFGKVSSSSLLLALRFFSKGGPCMPCRPKGVCPSRPPYLLPLLA